MKKLKLFLLVAMLFGMVACQDDRNPNQRDLAPIRTYKSYIETFVKCKKIIVQSVGEVKIDETKKVIGPCTYRWTTGETNPNILSVTDGIELDIYGHQSSIDEKDTCVFYDNSSFTVSTLNESERNYYLERKKGYDHYITLIGDTSYNAQLRADESSLSWAIITPLKSIVIVADKDFSNDYPAGSDLSPLFTVYFNDLYSTVKNGYKSIEGTYRFVEDAPFPESIRKVKLSEANFEERPFIGPQWLCFLDVAPETTGTYTFLVKATFVDGTVLESSAPPINIKDVND
jgi:hypothetical protein